MRSLILIELQFYFETYRPGFKFKVQSKSEWFLFRARRVQPVYLPPTAGVHGRRSGQHLRAFRQRHLRQGLHRPRHQPIKMLR